MRLTLIESYRPARKLSKIKKAVHRFGPAAALQRKSAAFGRAYLSQLVEKRVAFLE
ncbi:MAG TPA: hypothetical protein VGA59_01850 [Ramlibacter sp.]|jgi:hypothetical protein